MRSALGGCNFGDTQKFSLPPRQPDPSDAEEIWKTADAVTHLNFFLKKVKALRDAQNEHARTLNYGHRCLAIRLGKEVDEMLDKLKIE